MSHSFLLGLVVFAVPAGANNIWDFPGIRGTLLGVTERIIVCIPCIPPIYYPRSPGTHIVGSWVIGSICLYRDPGTGTQYIGNWASRAIVVSIFYSITLNPKP